MKITRILILLSAAAMLRMVSATENILPFGARQRQFVWSVSALVKRKLVQICTALLYNGNFAGFTDGNIWNAAARISACRG